MRTIKLKILLFMIFLAIFLLSFQSNVQYNDLLIFFNDPLNSIPNLALKFTSNSLIEYFNVKGIKVYTEFPLSLEAAFKIAKEKDIKYLLEIKCNLLNFTRATSGYSIKLDVFSTLYFLNDFNSKLLASDTGISENSLSYDIAYAYALYDGSIKAINKIEKELLNLLKK